VQTFFCIVLHDTDRKSEWTNCSAFILYETPVIDRGHDLSIAKLHLTWRPISKVIQGIGGEHDL